MEIFEVFHVGEYRDKINIILKQIIKLPQQTLYGEKTIVPKEYLGRSFKGKDMSGVDFSTKLLIGTDFSSCRLFRSRYKGFQF